MRFLVTGGAGFIGSHFARRLVSNAADNVIVLDKLTYAGDLRRLDNINGSFEFIKGSIGDRVLLENLKSRVDCVVNFAAESHVDNSLSYPETFFDSNVTSLIPLLQFSVENNLRFHQVSTDEVFGDLQLEEGHFSCKTPYNPSSPYAASKASADHLVRSWVRTFGLMGTISICSNNYGAWQHPEKLIPRSISLILEGKKPKLFGNGLNERDWIHVDDHVSGILAALDRGKLGETYLFGGGNVWKNLELIACINEIFGISGDSVEFIEDRLGHDQRYSIDFSESTESLGWKPQPREMRSELTLLIEDQKSLHLKANNRISDL